MILSISIDRSRFSRSRTVAFIISLAMVLLLFFVLVEMGLIDLDRGRSGAGARLVSVQIGAASPRPKQQAHAAKAQSAVKQAVPHPPTVHTVPLAKPSPSFIQLSHDDFAASDISKLAHPSTAGEGTGQTSSSYGPGEGAGGTHLYNAEWYRHPSDAELAGYMTHNAPPGSWATIECKTIEHYHVENCQELDESPPGSGLARALRLAAWQFLVRPPSVNGKPLVGAHVKIHFDFIVRARPQESEEPAMVGADQGQ